MSNSGENKTANMEMMRETRPRRLRQMKMS